MKWLSESKSGVNSVVSISAIFIDWTSELDFGFNMKVVALSLHFPTHIRTHQSDTRSSCYGPRTVKVSWNRTPACHCGHDASHRATMKWICFRFSAPVSLVTKYSHRGTTWFIVATMEAQCLSTFCSFIHFFALFMHFLQFWLIGQIISLI
jgi:hypothetical protein